MLAPVPAAPRGMPPGTIDPATITFTPADRARFKDALEEPGPVAEAASAAASAAVGATRGVAGVAAADLPAPTAGVVRVSDGAGLARALTEARPGQQIVLADGVYRAPGGDFVLRVDGTPDAPIVVRAENLSGARLEDPLRLLGGDQIASGLVLGGVQAEIDGDRSRLTRCQSVGTDGIAILVSGGVDTRVDHCELVGGSGRGISVDPDPRHPDALLRPRIDHNWLHDWAGAQGTNVREPIQIGQTRSQHAIEVGAIVEYNLLERVSVDPEAISIKSSGNIVRFNTLLDSDAAIVVRGGGGNRVEANWIEDARGIRVRGEANDIVANVIRGDGRYGIHVLAGDAQAGHTTRADSYGAATGTRLIGNDCERVVIGDALDGCRVAATGTLIQGHRGGTPVVTREAEGTVVTAGTATAAAASAGLPAASRLTAAEVGTGAADRGYGSAPITWTPATPSATLGERILSGIEAGRAAGTGTDPAASRDLLDAALSAMALTTLAIVRPSSAQPEELPIAPRPSRPRPTPAGGVAAAARP